MISDEELKNRKAFEAQLEEAGSLMSTAWDTDYDEYVYDEAAHMYRGWTLAQDALLTARAENERLRDTLRKEHGPNCFGTTGYDGQPMRCTTCELIARHALEKGER